MNNKRKMKKKTKQKKKKKKKNGQKPQGGIPKPFRDPDGEDACHHTASVSIELRQVESGQKPVSCDCKIRPVWPHISQAALKSEWKVW
jgi:hypothetical protein